MEGNPENDPVRVCISDIDVPVDRLMVFLVKLVLAAIPALILLSVIGGLLIALLSWIGSGISISR